ncbi:MAG: YfhO family protein [Bacteroidota bacterium]
MKGKKRPSAPRAGTGGLLERLTDRQRDLAAVGLMYLVTLFLFGGIVFGDGVFSGEGDTAAALAYKQAGDSLKETEGIDPLWMPYFFSGMPTFGNVHYLPHNVSYLQEAVQAVLNLLYLNATMGWMIVHFLLGGIFTYFLLRAWNLTSLPSLFGGLVFMLSPYFIGLAQEGHGSKLMALSYLPAVVLLTHLVLEKRTLLVLGLYAAGIGTLLLSNHMQIVYYVLATAGLYAAVRAGREFRREPAAAGKGAALLAAGLLLGLCISSYIYLSVHEYAQFSIRGGGTAGSEGGLTWDYATNWSFHPLETVTYLIPSFFGFSSSYPMPWQGRIQALPLYWGSMPFTTSTMYIGVLPILLSVVALVYRRNRTTLFFAGLTLLILLVSFGKHFAPLYDLLFRFLPFFNKFRAPSMILQLVPFTLGVLGSLGLAFLLEAEKGTPDGRRFRRAWGVFLGVIWAVLASGILFREGLFETLRRFMFTKAGENYSPQIMHALQTLRFQVLAEDYVKFVLIATASAGAMLLYAGGHIRRTLFGASVVGILLVDLLLVDVRFVHPRPGGTDREVFRPTPTIAFLKAQPGLFRIFPAGELFMDKTYAYHTLQSIGGYSPAKLKIYQTMLDSCLYRGADPAWGLNMNILNMLNTKYVIVQGSLPPDRFRPVHADQTARVFTYENPGALPRAWFVREAVEAAGDTEVFGRLNAPDFDPAATAVLQATPPFPVGAPESSRVEVTSYGAHRIGLKAFTDSPALLVLSEVYYPAGWRARVDGEETPILRTNSVLRSVAVPAGEHEVVFSFEPETYAAGWTISHAGWALTALLVLAGLWRRKTVGSRGGAPPGEKA